MEHSARTNEAPRIPALIHGAHGAAALELRPARAADLPALADILRDLWHTDAPAGAYAHLEGLHDVLCCLDRSTHHLVATLDGAPVGVCCGSIPAGQGPVRQPDLGQFALLTDLHRLVHEIFYRL